MAELDEWQEFLAATAAAEKEMEDVIESEDTFLRVGGKTIHKAIKLCQK